MRKEFFGKTPDGKDAYIYTLKNDDAEVRFTDYGARVLSFDAFGINIVGGFDKLETYFTDDSHQGATIGRVANRIAGASFSMDGKEYTLPKNDGDNCLHGGEGFDFRLWEVPEYDDEHIVFSYMSFDGEEGFPSNLAVKVIYTLSGAELSIVYVALPGGKTPVSLTNHSYFNLNGFGGDILSHKLIVYANQYTEVGENLIPTGKRPLVIGTPFDFRKPHAIGERIGDTEGGYDHNYILCPTIFKEFCRKPLGLATELVGDKLSMKVYTDQPGIQLYTGNFLGSGADFAGGIKQIKHGALCLETQTEPNSVNHGVGFYNVGKIYTHTTVYSVEKI
jgi:aldose 1-epimerase